MSISKNIVLLILVLANTACATESCVFSTDFFSEDKYRNNDLISTYEWSDERKEVKGVLGSGNLFSIKHWSCAHYGTHAVLFLGPNLEEIPENLNKHVLALAEISLIKDEVKLLSGAIKERSLLLVDSPQKITIPNNEYSEFYILYSIASEVIVIEIKLYRE